MTLEFPKFSFLLVCPRLSAGEGDNSEMPMDVGEKYQQIFFWIAPPTPKIEKGGEGQPAKMGHLCTVTGLIQSNNMANWDPHPILTSEKMVRNLDFYFSRLCQGCPKHCQLPSWYQRRFYQELELSLQLR